MRVDGGFLLAIEGIDAVGKNTHTLLLSRWLKRKRAKTSLMSFPDYRTPIGKEIKAFLSGKRAYPDELQHLLFAANRWEKYAEIRSRLGAGEIIIVNRYTESNLAYGSAKGLDVRWLANLEEGLPKADIVVLLDAAPASLRSRRPDESKDDYERSSALQGKARKAYQELAVSRRWKLVDASGPVKAVQARVLEAVRSGLKRERGVAI